jgi:hypothetical protein
MDEPFCVDPAQRVRAHAKLARVVGNNHGFRWHLNRPEALQTPRRASHSPPYPRHFTDQIANHADRIGVRQAFQLTGRGRVLNHTFQTLTPPAARKFAPVTWPTTIRDVPFRERRLNRPHLVMLSRWTVTRASSTNGSARSPGNRRKGRAADRSRAALKEIGCGVHGFAIARDHARRISRFAYDAIV